ncbi:MAG: hypothetical protein R3302_01120 [Sulfurimonadaceae bacterium]|nr:hypothetical protein [Sulfurimonadaceae bacterium]
MAQFRCGDAVQGVRKEIQGTITEVHVVAESISYTLVTEEKQVLHAYECDLMPYRESANNHLSPQLQYSQP